MKKLKVLLPLPILFIVLISCSKDDIQNDVGYQEANYTFYKSANLFSEAENNRSAEYSKEFKILSVVRVSNKLKIKVSYTGSCDNNKFYIIWSGAIMESWPMQTIFFVKRSAENCKNDNKIFEETLVVDLKKFMGDGLDIENTVFHVCNGSVEEGDPNDVVSTSVTNN